MHAFEFLKTTKQAKVRAIYAVSGDDAYLRDESLKAIGRIALGETADELAVARFSGDQASLSSVLDEVRTLPFLARCRVAIVDNADPFVTAHRKGLEVYAEKPSNAGVLVLSVKSWPGSTRLAKLVDKVGLAVECKTPSERELAPWLIQLAKTRYQTKLDETAARRLVELVGPEVGLLASEVEKLWVYVGERNVIAVEDVSKMVDAGRVESIFKTVEAATTGRGSQALEELDRILGSGDHPIQLMAAMTSTLRKVHHVGQLRQAKVELRAACEVAGVGGYGVEMIRQQHAHLGPSRVNTLPALLLQADLDLKGDSNLPARVILERLILQLADKRLD